MRDRVKRMIDSSTRPMTASDVAAKLGIPTEEAKRILESLVEDGEMNSFRKHSAIGFSIATEIKLAGQPRP